jgi:hypothetical protein
MTRQVWTSRLVVLVSGVLLAATTVFASAHSAVGLWPAGSQALAQAVPWNGQVRAAHATVAIAPGTRFGDDFERDSIGTNPPAGWTIADGVWDGVVNDGGRAVRHSQGQSYGHLVAGSPNWTDYRVSARLRPTPLSTGFAGVAARYRDRGDYYACGVYYGSAVRLWRVRQGSVTLLDARRMEVVTNRFHDVRLVVKGDRLSCVFDQAIVLSATEHSFSSGRIALVAGDDEAAEFDDIVVGD